MSSQANIHIIEITTETTSEGLTSSEVYSESFMRVVQGGNSLLFQMLSLPFLHLKALCSYPHIPYLIDQFLHSLDSDHLENLVEKKKALFGQGVEYTSQLMMLGLGSQIFPLAHSGINPWGYGEQPKYIIRCLHEPLFTLEFIHTQPQLNGDMLLQQIMAFNEKTITEDFSQYYIKPIDQGFSMPYNIILALLMRSYGAQIHEHAHEPGFFLKK